MEDIRGGLIVSVHNTHSEYRKWLEGANFFLVVSMDGTNLYVMVCGYHDGTEIFEGECDDLYPTPADINYPGEDDEEAWDKLEEHYAELLAKNARLAISDEEIRLEIGETYSSLLTDYEVVGGEESVDDEDDDDWV